MEPAEPGHWIKPSADRRASHGNINRYQVWRCYRARQADFMSRVVAWPPVSGIGHVNLHYSMKNPRGGKDIVTGKPFQHIDDFLNFCNWAETTNNIKDLWYCTSLQSETG